ncbi:MAG: GNAT family N-acetyltransferase [Bacilli bacterium]|jgi:RimJ/RimL family protein N-acetyltransferase|nr:GNAT family N-acetyltransferase [Bacilli bacterium]
MKETPFIRTERLSLRSFVYADARAVHEWCGSLSCTRYVFWHPHRDLAATERILAGWIRKRRNLSWALVLDGEPIGEVEIVKNLPGKGFEVGYILREESWGRGFMKEALSSVLAYMKGIGKLFCYAETDERNVSSRRLLERLGFSLIGEEKGRHIAKKDETINVVMYQKTF